MHHNDIASHFPLIIIALILIIAASLFFTFFTLERYSTKTGESIEAKKNIYLAMDRWLGETGHELVIYESGGTEQIIDSGKKNIMIFSSSFDWNDYQNLEELVRYENYHIVVFIDGGEDEDLSEFLFNFNIECRLDGLWQERSRDAEYGDDDKSDTDEAGEQLEQLESLEQKITFDEAVYFSDLGGGEETIDEKYLKDKGGVIRLIRLHYKAGSLIVSGAPFFMEWQNIRDSVYLGNPQLAWSISGALDTEKQGFALFRSKKAASGKTRHEDYADTIFGLFFQNKASYLIVLSALALIIAGFCVTFPAFGRWKLERTAAGKSITERFLCEGRFLKKYKALDFYLKHHADDIRAYYRQNGIDTDDAIVRYVHITYTIDREDIQAILNSKNKITAKDLLKYRNITMHITGGNKKHG
ncbi:MAG: hypothetical protein LBT01_08355 [Spirochaetaceae bacterium]|nr:hypothetical protein [Spirochaetaceae bacterium]